MQREATTEKRSDFFPENRQPQKKKFDFFLLKTESDFVPGRPGTEEFVPGHLLLPLSGTPGQDFFLSRDKGTTGRY